jgi:hypothetical protein
MYNINFLASAIGKIYEDMIPPYIFFALTTNKGAVVEVVVEDSNRFSKTYEKELDVIRSLRGDHFIIRNFSRPITYHTPNTYRFFEVPTIKAKYTYICDVDIMLLESIVDKYLDIWPSSSFGKIPYNNIIRKNETKLTGVHFVITDEYYTNELKKNQDVLYNSPIVQDEIVLYNLCAMTFGLPDLEYTYRPILGIHFSPNRGSHLTIPLQTSFKYKDMFIKLTDNHKRIFNFSIFNRLIHSLNTEFIIGTQAVYSALFSDKNKPSEPIQTFERLPGWDYILFTNLDLKSDSWTIRKIDLPNPDNVISAKTVKWLSHEYLPEYDIVCWIDAYCKLNNDMKSVLTATVGKLENAILPLFIKKHPDRDCVYDEVSACVSKRKISLDMYYKVSDFLKKHEMPYKYGLFETNLMLKYNNNPGVIRICKDVIHYIKTLTYRDQLVLTYVLFKNKVSKLENIEQKIVSCNMKLVTHRYVDKDQRRVAVCFWGIMRSLDFTLPSIQQNIFKPLDDAKIPYDVFLHTYDLNDDCSATYASECTLPINTYDFKHLKPTKYILENQKSADKKIGLDKYLTKGNPWKAPIEVAYNHVRALWSLKQVTTLWSNNNKNDITPYSHIMYCRPDMTYIMPIKPEWFVFSEEMVIPNFARHGRRGIRICDRFAIGMPDQMKIYGNRFDDALKYSKKHQLHSETYLGETLRTNHIKVRCVPFGFIRTRVDSRMNVSEDVKECITKHWYTKKQALNTQRRYSRKFVRKMYKTYTRKLLDKISDL